MKVTTQEARRHGKASRWGYVISDETGAVMYVSTYRFHSAESAEDAGIFDIDSLTNLHNEGEQDDTPTS